MLSLSSIQEEIAGSAYKTVKWLFEVTLDGSSSVDHFWSTTECSYGGENYEAKVIGKSFSYIDWIRAKSEFSLQAPTKTRFAISNPDDSSALTASDFKDCIVNVKVVVGDGTNEELFYSFLMVQESTPTDIQQQLYFNPVDIISRYIKGSYPKSALIPNIFPDSDTEYGNQNDKMCVPLVFGTAYIPLRPVFASSARRYLLGPVDTGGPTYSPTEVCAPRRFGKTTWSSGSYTFSQSSELGDDGEYYRCFRPLIMDTDSGWKTGLWAGNGDYLEDALVKFSQNDTSGYTNPAQVIEYILEDFGIPSAFINVSSAQSTYTSWGLTWNGGFWKRYDRAKLLALLLSMCHSTLDTSQGDVRLKVLVNDIQATITTSEVKKEASGETTFKSSYYKEEVHYDSGHIAFPFTGEPSDILKQFTVPCESTTNDPSDEVFEMPLVGDSQDAQKLGILKFQRKYGRDGEIQFNGRDSLIGVQPDDMIQMNASAYGGTYSALIGSIKLNKDLTLRISATTYRWTLDDWGDLAPSALSPSSSGTEDVWGTLQVQTDGTVYYGTISYDEVTGIPSSLGDINAYEYDDVYKITYDSLDDVQNGSTYARYLADGLSAGYALLSYCAGDLDDVDDGSSYGRVDINDLSTNHILLSTTIGDLDDVSDGSSYEKVLATDITAGHILLAQATGDLDDIANGSSYGRVAVTDISSGHIVLSTCSGDLDDITNGGTYEKVLGTDISSGHVLLSAVTGDLDDVDNGSTYGRVAVTDITSGHIVLSTCSGDLDDIANGGTYEKVYGTDITSGHVLLSACTGSLDNISDGSTYKKVLASALSGNTPTLSAAVGDLDDIDDGSTWGRVAATDITSGHIVLSTVSGDLDDIDDGTTYNLVRAAVIDSGYIKLLRLSATDYQRAEITASGLEIYYNNILVATYGSSLTIGQTSSGKYNVYITSAGMYLRVATETQVQITTTGMTLTGGKSIYFYNSGGSQPYIRYFTTSGYCYGDITQNTDHLILSSYDHASTLSYAQIWLDGNTASGYNAHITFALYRPSVFDAAINYKINYSGGYYFTFEPTSSASTTYLGSSTNYWNRAYVTNGYITNVYATKLNASYIYLNGASENSNIAIRAEVTADNSTYYSILLETSTGTDRFYVRGDGLIYMDGDVNIASQLRIGGASYSATSAIYARAPGSTSSQYCLYMENSGGTAVWSFRADGRLYQTHGYSLIYASDIGQTGEEAINVRGTTSNGTTYTIVMCDSTGVWQNYGNTDGQWSYYSLNSLSDSKLKEDISSIEDPVAGKMIQFNPVSYKIKGSQPTRFGFTADEIELIAPELISINRIMDEYEGDKNHAECFAKGYDFSALVTYMLKYDNEQQEMIDAAVGRIEDLEAQVFALQAEVELLKAA